MLIPERGSNFGISMRRVKLKRMVKSSFQIIQKFAKNWSVFSKKLEMLCVKSQAPSHIHHWLIASVRSIYSSIQSKIANRKMERNGTGSHSKFSNRQITFILNGFTSSGHCRQLQTMVINLSNHFCSFSYFWYVIVKYLQALTTFQS